jgi:hypothetical protein
MMVPILARETCRDGRHDGANISEKRCVDLGDMLVQLVEMSRAERHDGANIS